MMMRIRRPGRKTSKKREKGSNRIVVSWWSTRSPVRFLSRPPGRKEGGGDRGRIISFYSPPSPFVPSRELDVSAVPDEFPRHFPFPFPFAAE